MPGNGGDFFLQPVNDLDVLLADAAVAQEVLKDKLKKQTAEGLSQPWPLKAENKKNLRLQHAAGAFDPGVKTRARCVEKAECKYAKAFGHGAKFKRVRDMARVSIEYNITKSKLFLGH